MFPLGGISSFLMLVHKKNISCNFASAALFLNFNKQEISKSIPCTETLAWGQQFWKKCSQVKLPYPGTIFICVHAVTIRLTLFKITATNTKDYDKNDEIYQSSYSINSSMIQKNPHHTWHKQDINLILKIKCTMFSLFSDLIIVLKKMNHW